MPVPSLLRRCLPLAFSLAAGCAVYQPDVPLRSWLAGDIATVETFAAGEVQDGPEENLALVLNVQAQCELMTGKTEDARRNFERAAQIMGNWAVSGGEVTGAIVGSESSKTWVGDPYEKAMNAFYLAFCFLQYGEPDNARAALKRGILGDAEVADEKYQADNALLFWMAGRMSLLMGSADDAEGFFKEAVTANRFAIEHGSRGDREGALLSAPRRGNLVLLFECGMGPEKYNDGAFEELARFRPRPHPAVRARASLDGKPLGSSTIVVDVDYQARTLGGTEMEGIRQGKAVFKAASVTAGVVLLDQASKSHGDTSRTQAIVGGALLLLGLFTSSAADIRHWPTLPSTVQVLAADAPPGEHMLDVEFLDAAGRPLPSMRQQLQVTVPATGEAWYTLRSLPQHRAMPSAQPSDRPSDRP